MTIQLFKGVLQIDQPITDLTGTVCQPGRYEVFELEFPDPSAGITCAWVGLAPVSITDEQLQFFGDLFPDRFTFDPDAVLPAFEEGRKLLAAEQRFEEEQTRAWEAMRLSECGCKPPAMVKDDGTCSSCGAQVVKAE